MTTIPSIACLGVIGKNNNPLHISIFPSAPNNTPLRTPLQFHLLLSSCLDIFESRTSRTSTSVPLTGDFGLLHAIDERLAAYGFETNTSVKFIAVVDMRGRIIPPEAIPVKGGASGALGIREQEVKVVFRAMQAAYVRLLQNPFFNPDEYSPPTGRGGKMIRSRRFEGEMRRIGETWVPGVQSL